MLVAASSPSAVTTYRAVKDSPAEVPTVQVLVASSKTIDVTSVFSRKSLRRSYRSTTVSR